jgi:archaellum component FlaC
MVMIQSRRLDDSISKISEETEELLSDFDLVHKMTEASQWNTQGASEEIGLLNKGYDAVRKSYKELIGGKINLPYDKVKDKYSNDFILKNIIKQLNSQYVRYAELKRNIVEYNEMLANVADMADRALSKAKETPKTVEGRIRNHGTACFPRVGERQACHCGA